eukprot:TRINITY_DN45103_c0_g1_i1.p1 TRINITY_DN45103_c0_g1~~TRINITY_DN45103_c0_g1_i1.p1  ORF type:complete len:291 (+),score=82.12 TRINITY_DN45103_c0_g1_i1:109-981(+)
MCIRDSHRMDLACAVFDSGSACVKAGLTGHNPSELLRLPTGPELLNRGSVHDWDGLHRVWAQAIGTLVPAEAAHPGALAVLCAEESLQRPHRELVLAGWFEDIGTDCFSVAHAAALACIGAGRSSGALVLDCGHGLQRCSPVVGGYVPRDSCEHVLFGGQDIDMLVAASLPEHLQHLGPAVKRAIGALTDRSGASQELLLPDHSSVTVHSATLRCPEEALFERTAGRQSTEELLRSVQAGAPSGCDEGCVILAGGTCAMTGLAQRLQQACLLYTSPSPRDRTRSRMPSSA